MRETSIEHLALEPGDRVLDVGCGPGVNFELIRNEIGETGRLVAVDYSPEMVAKARERIERHGWENVEVRRGDATRADFDEPFDAALATLSMSCMPDVLTAVENVHRHLVSGAPFGVVDLGPAPSGPIRVLNPLVWRFFRWYANWNPDGDVVGSLEAVFETCEVTDRNLAGFSYTAFCRKSPKAGDSQSADR